MSPGVALFRISVIFAPVISVSDLTYYIGGRPLFEKASLFIKPGDKVGLIGLNGKGKTTLLKLINGDITPDSGSISKSNDCTIGFLNQDLLSYQSDDPILEVAMSAFKTALEVQHEIDKILKVLETDHSEKILEKLSRLQEEFDRLGGYTIQARAEEVLEGIGFATGDLHRPLREFSGGWRMRVMLAKLLLEQPSLLMLDEPTNHLDLPSIEWVENYLKNYSGAVIVVSHDRRFLDMIANRTAEVINQQIVTYEGNYSFYLEEKELRTEIQKNAFENQQQKIRQTERFIERFRAKSTKARQVQSRVKALERMDRIEDIQEDVAQVNFRFQFSKPSGRHVVTLKHIGKSYGELHLLANASAAVERGDKIALIGANGRGKSTLLRILDGTEAFEGERVEGHNVIPAFYAQHQLESLNVDNEILDELKQAGSGKTEQQLRNVLGCFLFSEEEVFKKIKVLSGGEKSRVALAKTLIAEANFLLLDEPTNHLDFISENILIQALQQYQGTIVVVSHNRYFISEVANKIWYIENQQIKEYPGNYEEYQYWRSMRESSGDPLNAKPDQKIKSKPSRPSPSTDNSKVKELEKDLKKIEEQLEEVEATKNILEEEMAKPEVYGNFERLQQVQEKLRRVESAIAENYRQWDALVEAIKEASAS